MSPSRANLIGLPASCDSNSASSAACASASVASFSRAAARAPCVRPDQRPSSNASRAAATARSTSANELSGTWAIGSPLAGPMTSTLLPELLSTSSPLINSLYSAIETAPLAGWNTETPPAKARGVLVACPPLLLYCEHSVALDGRLQDFGADALWHGTYPCCGASLAPHSHVL